MVTYLVDFRKRFQLQCGIVIPKNSYYLELFRFRFSDSDDSTASIEKKLDVFDL